LKQYHNLRDGLSVFKCLSSEFRISIMELLYKNGPMHMTDIAQELGVTCGTLSPHIKMLTTTELITVTFVPGKHGVQRLCSIGDDRILVDPGHVSQHANVYESEIGVGQYTDYEVYPTCGLATTEHLIGVEDDPKYFASPERVSSGILWMGHGYVEYILPNFLKPNQRLIDLQISLEIASEAPGFCEEWPSDIYFYLNDIEFCTWTCPGDFGNNTGIFTPSWWNRNWNQHGQYKLLSITHAGSYVDGIHRSDVTLEQLNIQPGVSLRLKIAAPRNAAHAGGLTIYGRGFGDYNQDIVVRMHYTEDNNSSNGE